jgi:glutamate-5-semialdehyde dehydrogenase
MQRLPTTVKDKVLDSMMRIIGEKSDAILAANQQDLTDFSRDDQALYDRLVVDQKKIEGMIQSIRQVRAQDDPVGREISHQTLDSGLRIVNMTDPFGTIMIIYESRPDVTIEAAVLAFKANNKILLKGGKEAYHSNKILVECWHEALRENAQSTDWIKMLELDREATQAFLKNPTEPLDLIVPRGGEGLIKFVKIHANCAVLVSGRGNNFLYVAPSADWQKTIRVIVNAKTDKISACNALDKVLIDAQLPKREAKVKELVELLQGLNVQVSVDAALAQYCDAPTISGDDIWHQEFLAMQIVIGSVDGLDAAITKINAYSGRHSSVIMTEDAAEAQQFMEQVDSAAVYHNASSRFTDGGQMGVGAELAISTDKLHHRGPLGLKQLVTNKYYVYGDGHVRT